jgi:hypothetical protein
MLRAKVSAAIAAESACAPVSNQCELNARDIERHESGTIARIQFCEPCDGTAEGKDMPQVHCAGVREYAQALSAHWKFKHYCDLLPS